MCPLLPIWISKNICKNTKPCEFTFVKNKELLALFLQQILRTLKMPECLKPKNIQSLNWILLVLIKKKSVLHGTVKIKHVLHTPNIRIYLHIRKNCELVWREDVKNLQRRGWAVPPPIRSIFPDYVPFTDFFEEIGPDLVCIVWEKSNFCRYYYASWIQLLYQQANRPITWF